MTEKHIHCDVIKAWADGAEIEFRCNPDDPWALIDKFPSWYEGYEYRVNPKPITKWYRVALFKTGNGVYFGFVSENDFLEKTYEAHCNFIRWVTDRQYVEV